MRLDPESLKVESYPTSDTPEQVGAASSDTGIYDCSSYCRRPTCRYEVCG
jgi:hypothetical protein